MDDQNIKIDSVSFSNEEKEVYKFKVVVVGDSGVGKTNLIKRFINNSFYKNNKSTIGVEFFVKNFIINGELYKVEFWDTAGQERYKSITAAYYKGAKGAMIVYDITSEESFGNVNKWISEIKDETNKNITLMIVGNKTDLEEKRVINIKTAEEKAKSLSVPIIETSALDCKNVNEAFTIILREMYKTIKNVDSDNNMKKEKLEGNALNLNIEKDNKKECCF